MAVRSCFSCEWQNPHFQSQVLAPIMHWCQPHPIMFRSVSHLSLGGPASPLRNKLLTSSELLLILQQPGPWLWVGYEDTESDELD